MWHWMKHWRDWAMNELWTPHRLASQASALYFRCEKAGLTLENQPIPWNAEAVLVEALLRLPLNARRKSDYTLRLPGQAPLGAESLKRDEGSDRHRLFFRFPPPPATTHAELLWQHHTLGRVELPVLTPDEFNRELRLHLPTVFVQIGTRNVAARTFVSTQCQGLAATAVVRSPSGLIPLLDAGLHVRFRSERTGRTEEVAAPLVASQLVGREALVSVVPTKLPRKIGEWTVSWALGDQVLSTHRLRAISLRAFHESLRVSDTRFLVASPKGDLRVARQLPPRAELARAGPCFLISSCEAGMAGLVRCQVVAQVPGAEQPQAVLDQEVFVTDGPSAVAPGMLEAAELSHVTAFDLRVRDRQLGALPLSPVPQANFNSEGAFKPPPDFSWTNLAEEELNERLSRLIDLTRDPPKGMG
jgi:hypothetical protein